MTWLLILLLGFIGGTIGAIVGFGGSIILLPALTVAFGPKAAVPIMGVAAVLANLSRVIVWWREVDWRAALVYSAAGAPAAALGARTMLGLDARLVEAALGVFLIAMIPVRRWLLRRGLTIGLAGLAFAGAGVGYLTGIVASTGPLSTPFFLAYGLDRGGFIATEALCSLLVYISKAATFNAYGALPLDLIFQGAVVGLAMMAGSWMAKRIMAHVHADQFQFIMDAMMLVAGAYLMISAIL